MSLPPDHESRHAALDARVARAGTDAAAARHLAAAQDRDVADLGVRVDAGFEETRQGFTQMRGLLDQAAAGQQQIVDLITTLIDDRGDG